MQLQQLCPAQRQFMAVALPCSRRDDSARLGTVPATERAFYTPLLPVNGHSNTLSVSQANITSVSELAL